MSEYRKETIASVGASDTAAWALVPSLVRDPPRAPSAQLTPLLPPPTQHLVLPQPLGVDTWSVIKVLFAPQFPGFTFLTISGTWLSDLRQGASLIF